LPDHLARRPGDARHAGIATTQIYNTHLSSELLKDAYFFRGRPIRARPTSGLNGTIARVRAAAPTSRFLTLSFPCRRLRTERQPRSTVTGP